MTENETPKKVYNKVKYITVPWDYDDATWRVTFDLETPDLWLLTISFEWYDETRQRDWEGKYGPWRIMWNIDIKWNDVNIDDWGLFCKSKWWTWELIEGSAWVKIKPWIFLDIYEWKEPNTFSVYYKTEVKEERDTSEDPF